MIPFVIYRRVLRDLQFLLAADDEAIISYLLLRSVEFS